LGRGLESMFRNLKRVSTGISLVILWLGFTFLGILSWISRLPEDAVMVRGLEKECCVAGSVGSVFAGTIFFVAACLYWKR
jgi:hypothetical protein